MRGFARTTGTLLIILVVALGLTVAPASASGHTFTDGFEDEPPDSGIPEDWSIFGGGITDPSATFNVTTDRANTGSQSFGISSDAGDTAQAHPTYQPFSPRTTDNISVSVYLESGSVDVIVLDDGSEIDGVRVTDENTGELRTTFNTVISTGVTTGEWIDITMYDFNFTADTFSVTWDSPSDSGTQTGIAMGSVFEDIGYDRTDVRVSSTNPNVAFVDDFQVGQDTLSGFVMNEKTDTPVENARVTAFNTTDGSLTEVASTTTDAQGNWSLDIPDDQYELVYNKSAYFQSIDNVTKTGATDVGRQNLTPIPTAYLNADPRAFEYIQNRKTNGFNISIQTREPVGQDSQVTSRFMWYNETSGEYEQFNSITWNTQGGQLVTHDFQTPISWDNGTQTWFVNTTTDRGSFHSANYSFITPGNLTFVDASDGSVITDARIRVNIAGLEDDSDFEQTLATPPPSGGPPWSGTIDLNNISKEDLRLTIDTIDGESYLDRTLIIDSSQIGNLWQIALVNSTDFNAADSTYYNQSFTLDDQTGQWEPRDTYLFLSQKVGGKYELVAGDVFGTPNNVTLTVNATEEYRLTLLHATRGEIREKGFFDAQLNLSDTTITIPVTNTDESFSDIDSGFQINASIVGAYDENVDPPFLVIKYQDPDSLTFDLEFTVYERNNQSNILRGLENVTYDNLGTLVFEQPLSSEEARNVWVVDWQAERNGNTIEGKIIVGARGELGVPISTEHKNIIAIIVILMIAGLASQVNAVAVAMAVSGTSGIAWYIQWLPAEVGVTMLALGMSVPALYLARSRRLE